MKVPVRNKIKYIYGKVPLKRFMRLQFKVVAPPEQGSICFSFPVVKQLPLGLAGSRRGSLAGERDSPAGHAVLEGCWAGWQPWHCHQHHSFHPRLGQRAGGASLGFGRGKGDVLVLNSCFSLGLIIPCQVLTGT